MNFKTTGILALVLCIGIAAVVLLNKQDEKKEAADKIEGKLVNIEADSISEIILQPSGIHCRRDSCRRGFDRDHFHLLHVVAVVPYLVEG